MKVQNLPLKAWPDILAPPDKKPRGFEELLRAKLREVDQDQKEALFRLQAFAAGKDTDVAGLSMALARAELSFRMVLRIRNKILEAYQEIMRMQI
ncbi:flagellar hook-basal body complex protein FliE [Thermosulfurimonas sp.]|uniref:flagellar hook-basal body complex protein FliE n=1 Tax=Thermosulfurimonas sp. TaxID=2080236 RepID=UPI0025CD7137|nr:flagellar hook-basal body complex protein FliE [Thermosulfurimonas sp.]